MSDCLKKRILKPMTYNPKNTLKHKHNYCLKYLLIITNVNEKASIGYYNSKEYYYVLKCDKCDSFIPNSIEGNFDHHIFLDKEEIDDRLPIITASTMQKNPAYNFRDLKDVLVNEKV